MTPTEKGQMALELFNEEDSTALAALDRALAEVDSLKADFVFAPGNMNAIIAKHRELALAEVAGLNPSTANMQEAIKKTKNKLVKSRTFIQGLHDDYVRAEKKRLKTVDTVAGDIWNFYQMAEAEVLSVTGYTAWQQGEEDRKMRLSNAVAELAAKGQRIYPDTASIESAIAELESFTGEKLFNMQEFSISAESAITASLKVLKPELERSKQLEAQQAELAQLRAEAAERVEQNRMARVAKDAVEAERKRNADAAKAEYEAMELRAADDAHRNAVHDEIRAAILKTTAIDDDMVMDIIVAIADGLIPHVSITY